MHYTGKVLFTVVSYFIYFLLEYLNILYSSTQAGTHTDRGMRGNGLARIFFPLNHN